MGITNPAEQHFERGLWGFDGSVWRKLPMLWGYTDRYAEEKSNLSCTAGANILTFSTVPAGEVWRVTALTWVNVNTACVPIAVQLADGVNTWTVYVEAAGVANVYASRLVDITLKEGDCLRVAFYGCTLNDDIFAWVLGYKMAVT